MFRHGYGDKNSSPILTYHSPTDESYPSERSALFGGIILGIDEGGNLGEAAAYYETAANTGGGFPRHAEAAYKSAQNRSRLSILGQGVPRSKRKGQLWTRKAAELGATYSAEQCAIALYLNLPYAREDLLVASAPAVSDQIIEENPMVPASILPSVVYWLSVSRDLTTDGLNVNLRRLQKLAVEGGKFCFNEGCDAKGLLNSFRVCSKCKVCRYCSKKCQEEDWAAGHKTTCGRVECDISTQP